MKEAQINALVAKNPNQIAAPALRLAIVELAARQQKEQTENAIRQLSEVEAVISIAVSSLREARKLEAKAKAYLVAVDAARAQFHANGDYDTFHKAVRAAQIQHMIR